MAESDRVGEAKNDSAVMVKRSDVQMTILGDESSMAAGRRRSSYCKALLRAAVVTCVLLVGVKPSAPPCW